MPVCCRCTRGHADLARRTTSAADQHTPGQGGGGGGTSSHMHGVHRHARVRVYSQGAVRIHARKARKRREHAASKSTHQRRPTWLGAPGTPPTSAGHPPPPPIASATAVRGTRSVGGGGEEGATRPHTTAAEPAAALETQHPTGGATAPRSARYYAVAGDHVTSRGRPHRAPKAKGTRRASAADALGHGRRVGGGHRREHRPGSGVGTGENDAPTAPPAAAAAQAEPPPRACR
jgi:hypothetical protein